MAWRDLARERFHGMSLTAVVLIAAVVVLVVVALVWRP
jgi:hypothetical protein